MLCKYLHRDTCRCQNNSAVAYTPRISSRHFWSDSDTRLVGITIINIITFTSTLLMRCTSFVRYLYFVNYSTCIFRKISPDGVETSFSKHVTFSTGSMRSDLLNRLVLIGVICWFQNRISWLSWLPSTDFAACSYYLLLSLSLLLVSRYGNVIVCRAAP
jgi:hypothetical protein